jgi:hypothetical protein
MSTPSLAAPGVARKTIYNHPDLLELIRTQSTNPAPRTCGARHDCR